MKSTERDDVSGAAGAGPGIEAGRLLEAKVLGPFREGFLRKALIGAEALCVRWGEAAPAEVPPGFVATLNRLAARLLADGEMDEARAFFEEARSFGARLLGPDDPEAAAALHGLGTLARTGGELVAAEAFYRRALEIRRAALGERHPDSAATLNGLALVYSSSRDPAKAEPLLRRALEIRRAVLGERHPDTASSLNNLGAVWLRLGDAGGAEALLGRALEIRRAVLGERHPDTLVTSRNLATARRLRTPTDEAGAVGVPEMGPGPGPETVLLVTEGGGIADPGPWTSDAQTRVSRDESAWWHDHAAGQGGGPGVEDDRSDAQLALDSASRSGGSLREELLAAQRAVARARSLGVRSEAEFARAEALIASALARPTDRDVEALRAERDAIGAELLAWKGRVEAGEAEHRAESAALRADTESLERQVEALRAEQDERRRARDEDRARHDAERQALIASLEAERSRADDEAGRRLAIERASGERERQLPELEAARDLGARQRAEQEGQLQALRAEAEARDAAAAEAARRSEDELGRLRAELQSLTAAHDEALRQRDELGRQLSALEAARGLGEQERAGLEERLQALRSEAETDAAEAVRRFEDERGRREQAERDLAALRDERDRVQAELDARTTAHEETLHRRAELERQLPALEEAQTLWGQQRADLEARLQTLRAEADADAAEAVRRFGAERHAREQAGRDIEGLRDELERVRAELQSRANDHEEALRQTAELGSRLSALGAAGDLWQQERAGLEGQTQALRAEAEALRDELGRVQADLYSRASAHGNAVRQLDEVRATRDRLERELIAAREAVQECERADESLRAQAASATESRRELARKDEEIGRLAQELTTLRRDAATREADLRHELERVQGEFQTLQFVRNEAATNDTEMAAEALSRAWALQRVGELEKATRIYREVLGRDPENLDAWAQLGAVALRRGDIPEAVAALQHAIRLEPDRADLHSNLGIAFAIQGSPDDAIECFQRALQIEPNDDRTRRNLAQAFSDRKAKGPPRIDVVY